jgi:hypothetical protein
MSERAWRCLHDGNAGMNVETRAHLADASLLAGCRSTDIGVFGALVAVAV